MYLDLTEDQRMIQNTARNFARSELEPVAEKSCFRISDMAMNRHL